MYPAITSPSSSIAMWLCVDRRSTCSQYCWRDVQLYFRESQARRAPRSGDLGLLPERYPELPLWE
jgi:hypothetical protein